MKKVSTGIDGLDRVLGGGVIEGNCVLVEGAPGAGKTTLGLQFIYSGATLHGERGLVVTFEESPEQIYHDASVLGWDLRSLEKQGMVRVLCISPQIFSEQLSEPDGLIDLLKAELDVKRIIIDSTTHFQQVTPHPYELRNLLFGLKNGFRRLRMTSMLMEELEMGSGGYIPFGEYVVDTVFRLCYEPVDGGRGRARTIEVLKSRGQAHVAGRHAMSISEGGIKVYPRVMPISRSERKIDGELERVGTGIAGLDEMLGGGLYRGFFTLIAGSTGTGKTTLGLQFLADGAAKGEQTLLVTFEERPWKIEKLSETCGLDISGAVESGKLRIMHRPLGGLFLEEFLHEVAQEVEAIKPQRVVVDSLTDISLAIDSTDKLREAIWSLAAVLESSEATVLMTNEITSMLGQFSISETHLSVLVDGIILLRYVEIESEMQRAISVLKMRGMDHDKNIRRFTIGDRGLEVGAMFEGQEGIMGGSPRAQDIAMSLFSIDEEDQKLNTEITTRFSRLNPRVRVEPMVVSFNPDEARDMVMNVLRSKTTDMGVVPVDVYWMPEMARQRMLRRLDHFFTPADRKAFLDVAVGQSMYDGHTYGVPAFITAGALLYRKDLLDKHGFAPPRTWDELVEQCKVIKAAEGGDLAGLIFQGHEYEGLACNVLEFIWNNGGCLDDPGSDRVVEAFRFMHDLIHTYGVSPEAVTRPPTGMEGSREFVEGKAIFLRLWPHVMQSVESEHSAVKGKVGIAPLPIGPKGSESHSVLGGWNLCIPTHAKSPSAAWSFIKYSTSYESQKLKAIRGGPLPTLSSLYTDPELLRSKPYYLDLPKMYQSGRLRQEIPNYPAVSKLLQRHAGCVLRGEVDPERAVEVMAKEIKELGEKE